MDVLRSLAPWLVAVAAVTALAVVLAGAPPAGGGTAAVAPTASASLPLHPGATAVEGIFGNLKPYSVQRDMGASGGKAADCSIYSDGDLDSGANVTWAVTLCVVHTSAAGVSG